MYEKIWTPTTRVIKHVVFNYKFMLIISTWTSILGLKERRRLTAQTRQGAKQVLLTFVEHMQHILKDKVREGLWALTMLLLYTYVKSRVTR